MASEEEGRESLQQDEHQRDIYQPEEDPRPTLTVALKEGEITSQLTVATKENERVEEEEKKEERRRTNQAEAEYVEPLLRERSTLTRRKVFHSISEPVDMLQKVARTLVISSRFVSKLSLLKNNSVEAITGDPTNGDDERYSTSICLKSMKKLLNKKRMIKWIFILLNIGLELSQVVFSQEAGDGKMKGSLYRKLGAIFSSICLTMSLLELVYEGKRHGVEWRSNGGCYCFRYPTPHGRIFGRFSLWVGLISAALQFSLNIASLVLKRGALKFDHLGLLLSVGYFFAALRAEHVTMSATVKCSSHGSHEVEGKLVEGIWQFECPRCQPENRV